MVPGPLIWFRFAHYHIPVFEFVLIPLLTLLPFIHPFRDISNSIVQKINIFHCFNQKTNLSQAENQPVHAVSDKLTYHPAIQ